MKVKKAPILISGMHRSGTSMVTKILNRCGLDIGNKLDSNSESIFFQRINIWMMSLVGSSWDSPKKFDKINDEIKIDIVSQLQKLIQSRTNSLYFGWANILKKGTFENIETPWGWKDPRNTFTQDIWREVFPDLKVVNIIRHPIDVSASLMKRQAEEIQSDIKRKKRVSSVLKALLSISHSNYNSSMLLNSHEDCHNLIDVYYDQMLTYESSNTLTIKFEDILTNPEIEIMYILNHCGLDIGSKQLNEMVKGIDGSRKYAYKNDGSLINLESSFRDLIYKMGYKN